MLLQVPIFIQCQSVQLIAYLLMLVEGFQGFHGVEEGDAVAGNV